jgi:thioredoxin 1
MSAFKEIIREDLPVLVEFYTEWYTPCAESLEVLTDLKAHFGDKLRILKVDADTNVEATAKYKIISVPAFLLFQSGQLLWRTYGELKKDQLIGAIEEALEKNTQVKMK